jgi:type IV pilus assembly protein PilB
MALKLGEMLLDKELITKEQLEHALEYQQENGGKLGFNLVKLGYITDEDITQFLSEQYGVPAVDLANFEIDEGILKLIPSEVAQKYNAIPLSRSGASLTVAMSDPGNVFAVDDIKFMTGYDVETVVASEMAIREAIDKYYGKSSALQLKELMEEMEAAPTSTMPDIDDLEDTEMEVVEDVEDLDIEDAERAAETAPVIKLVNHVIRMALEKGASDIHIEPYEKDYRLRYRVDGVLFEEMRLPMKMKDGITSRLKIMASLDIAEKRLPQDGRIKAKMTIKGAKKEIDFRFSVLPTLWGEKIVMRILDKEGLMLDMTKLGFEKESLELFMDCLMKPYGMILVTGPTGSGKTNTLYSAMATVNQPDVNIMTAEDPVEFNIYGINQVQMRDRIGLNMAAALRSFLRQDPDVILVGEVRDFETGEIAIKAALTGHLVLSTLHTNDSPSTVSRLMNMGIEPFLVATSVLCIVAQRLARKICSNCKKEIERPPAQSLIDIGFTPEEAESVTLYKGEGCSRCINKGYKGRIALFEVMRNTEQMQDLILCGANSNELRRLALEQGMISLRASGLAKIKNGVTTIEEVLRTTMVV